MIELDQPKQEDRTIHKVYTPKEIIKIIAVALNNYYGLRNLSHSESLLVWDYAKQLEAYFNDE